MKPFNLAIAQKLLIDAAALLVIFAVPFTVIEFLVPHVLAARIPLSVVVTLPMILLLAAQGIERIRSTDSEHLYKKTEASSRRFRNITHAIITIPVFLLALFLTRHFPLLTHILLTLLISAGTVFLLRLSAPDADRKH